MNRVKKIVSVAMLMALGINIQILSKDHNQDNFNWNFLFNKENVRLLQEDLNGLQNEENNQNNGGNMPLLQAALNGNALTVRRLINPGANINVVNNQNNDDNVLPLVAAALNNVR